MSDLIIEHIEDIEMAVYASHLSAWHQVGSDDLVFLATIGGEKKKWVVSYMGFITLVDRQERVKFVINRFRQSFEEVKG